MRPTGAAHVGLPKLHSELAAGTRFHISPPASAKRLDPAGQSRLPTTGSCAPGQAHVGSGTNPPLTRPFHSTLCLREETQVKILVQVLVAA